ncbi:MAG: HAD family hydrolase [Candidatus Geothermarchaeales archaeon]
MKKRAVLFDLGGTLIRLGRSPEEVWRRILEEHGVRRSEGEIRRVSNDTLPGVIPSFGKMPPDEYWALWDGKVLRGLGVEDSEGALAREIHERFNAVLEPEAYKDVLPTLDELRRRGIRLGMISNGYVEEIETMLDMVGIPKEGFDVIVGVDTVGEAKPSPAVFRRALEEMDVDPGECIFVGDDARRDCEGALNMGITPYLVVRDEKQDTDPRFRTISSLSEIIELEYVWPSG